MHCKAMTPQNVVSAPRERRRELRDAHPDESSGSSYAAAMPEKNTDGMSPNVAKKSEKSCASASRRPVTKARVDTGRAPRIRASRRSGSAFSPDHDRDESGCDHGERQQHETIGGNGWAERSGLVAETRVFLDEDTGERQGGRGYEDDAPDHERISAEGPAA